MLCVFDISVQGVVAPFLLGHHLRVRGLPRANDLAVLDLASEGLVGNSRRFHGRWYPGGEGLSLSGYSIIIYIPHGRVSLKPLYGAGSPAARRSLLQRRLYSDIF